MALNVYMGQVIKVGLSCYLVLLAKLGNKTLVTWPIYSIAQCRKTSNEKVQTSSYLCVSISPWLLHIFLYELGFDIEAAKFMKGSPFWYTSWISWVMGRLESNDCLLNQLEYKMLVKITRECHIESGMIYNFSLWICSMQKKSISHLLYSDAVRFI